MALSTNLATDLNDVFFSSDDFAVSATWTPSGEAAQTVKGIFDKEFIEVEIGDTIVQERELTFTCQSSDLTSPAQIAEDDTLAIDSVTYVVIREEKDGTGVSMVKLKANT